MWEYAMLFWDSDKGVWRSNPEHVETTELVPALNQMGAGRWELVVREAPRSQTGGGYKVSVSSRYLFKRPKAD